MVATMSESLMNLIPTPAHNQETFARQFFLDMKCRRRIPLAYWRWRCSSPLNPGGIVTSSSSRLRDDRGKVTLGNETVEVFVECWTRMRSNETSSLTTALRQSK